MKPTYNFLIIITLMLLSNIVYSQSVPSYVPTNGLVGWWGFNGNAQDGSGNGNHGTVNGATLTTDRFGNQNGAYDFDGVNDYIQVGGNYNLLLDSNFSISCWVKLTGLNTFNTFLSNASNNQTNVSGWVWGYNYFYQPARIHFQAFPFYNNSTVSQIGNNLVNNIWSNVLVTYNKNNGNLIYYLNGQSTDTFFVAYTIFNANLDLFIGNHFQNNNPNASVPTNASFTGNIDDIGIWNRALTQQEITNLYNSQLPTQTSLCLPTITTSSPTSVGVDTVVIGGDISNDGGSSIVLRGVCYSTSPSPNMGNLRTEDGAGTGSFNTVLRGLNPSTTYYARSYAKNSNGVVVYGNEVSFSTSSITIGSNYAGGIVFYLDSTGQHGLVSAPYDQGTYQWGCHQGAVYGLSFALGSGQTNTSIILNSCPTRPIAASICDTLNLNGYSDWYLPSFSELDLMCDNLRRSNLGSFSSGWYWSSSTHWYFFEDAYCRLFSSDCVSDYYEKYLTHSVRAIRSF